MLRNVGWKFVTDFSGQCVGLFWRVKKSKKTPWTAWSLKMVPHPWTWATNCQIYGTVNARQAKFSFTSRQKAEFAHIYWLLDKNNWDNKNWIIHGVSSSIILRLLGKNDGFETSFGLVLLVACFFFNFYSVLLSSDSLICLLRRLSIYRNGLTHHTQVDFMRKVFLVSQPFYSFLQENLDCMRAQNQFALLSRKSVDKVLITQYINDYFYIGVCKT